MGCSFCRVISQTLRDGGVITDERRGCLCVPDGENRAHYSWNSSPCVLLSIVVVTLRWRSGGVADVRPATSESPLARSLGGYKLIGVRTASAMQAAARPDATPALRRMS